MLLHFVKAITKLGKKKIQRIQTEKTRVIKSVTKTKLMFNLKSNKMDQTYQQMLQQN